MLKKLPHFAFLVIIIIILLTAYASISYYFAQTLSTNPLAKRQPFSSKKKNAFKKLELSENLFEEVQRTNDADQILQGWYYTGVNKKVILIQHGYKKDRVEMLPQAKVFMEAGYSVLLASIRSHDQNTGSYIYFGKREIEDVALFYQFLIQEKNYAPEKVGLLGNSLGATIILGLAAKYQTPGPIISHSAFFSLAATVNIAIPYYTGLPAWLFAPPIVAILEQKLEFKVNDINAKTWTKTINAPIFFLQGGNDMVVPKQSGKELYNAAPSLNKKLWYEPTFGHTDFEKKAPEKYRSQTLQFFNEYFAHK